MAQNRAELHRGHRQRMFQRFMEGGFDGYRPHEILEQLLFEPLSRRNTNELAHELIDRFGSLRGVLLAEREALMEVRGIGKATADFLVSILPATGKAICDQLRGVPPERGSLLVLADFYLNFCAFPMGVVLLDENGAFLDFLPMKNAEEFPAGIPDCASAILLLCGDCDPSAAASALEAREIRIAAVYRITGDHRLLPG